MSWFSLMLGAVAAVTPVQALSPDTQRALGTLSSLGAAVGGADLQPTQAMAAASVGHARAFVERLDFPAAAAAAVQLCRTQVMARAESIGVKLPETAKAALTRDMAAAFDAAASHYVSDQLAFASIWFAQRLTYDVNAGRIPGQRGGVKAGHC